MEVEEKIRKVAELTGRVVKCKNGKINGIVNKDFGVEK